MPDRRSVGVSFCYENSVRKARSCAQKQWITLWDLHSQPAQAHCWCGFSGIAVFLDALDNCATHGKSEADQWSTAVA